MCFWKQTWHQELDYISLADFNCLYDEAYLDENGFLKKWADIPMKEIFNKADAVFWSDINSNISKRNMSFNIDGSVSFSKKSKKKDLNYQFMYNVGEKGFKFKGNDFSISDDYTCTKIKTSNGESSYFKNTSNKIIEYTSNIVDKTSVFIRVILDDDDNVSKCYFDFRTHKSNGKINGIYLIRIDNKNLKFNFSYRSRKGNVQKFIEPIYYNDENISIDNLKSRVEYFIDAINSCYRNDRQVLSSNVGVDKLGNMMKNIVGFMGQIKGEIPLPYLQEQVDKFIVRYSDSKRNSKIKKLQ